MGQNKAAGLFFSYIDCSCQTYGQSSNLHQSRKLFNFFNKFLEVIFYKVDKPLLINTDACNKTIGK